MINGLFQIERIILREYKVWCREKFFCVHREYNKSWRVNCGIYSISLKNQMKEEKKRINLVIYFDQMGECVIMVNKEKK